MAKRGAKNKVIGKSVRIEQGEDGRMRALEYEHRQGGPPSLTGIRVLVDAPLPGRDLAGLKHLDIVAFNSEAEQLFVELLAAMCDVAGDAGVSVRAARAECAFRIGVSTETIKRYIEKWTAPSAPFEIRDGAIFKKK